MGVQLARFRQLDFVYLDKPRCIHSSPLNVPVSESSSNLIPCDIDGIPKATTYRWILNTTGKEETLRQTTPTLTLRQKKIQFPEDKKIVGQVKCWASNSVGESEYPCTFVLVAAGKICAHL